MNIFHIPSWYPSPSHPLAGIFFHEQALLFSQHHRQANIGISHWGQNDERLLLWGKDNFWNIGKILKAKRIRPAQTSVNEHLKEYFSPAFTWSKKMFSGNMKNIIRVNGVNLKRFETDFGKVDLIHAHVGYPAGYIAYTLSRKFEIPYVITEHMSPLPFRDYVAADGKWMKELMLAYQNASRIITVSHAMKEQFAQKGFSHTTCIHNFIDDDFFSLAKKSESPIINCLTIARMTHQKGIDILLRAIASGKDKIENLHFTFIGGGEDIEEYKKLARNLGLESKVTWKGEMNRQQVKEHLLQSDLMILPSRHESFGIVVTEALACGKPCIVTRCGGPEEIITDEVGIVVEKENPEALAQAILKMRNNLEKFSPKEVRAYYEKHFSARQATEKLMKVYEEVIGG